VDAEQNGHLAAVPYRSRRWLAVAAVALVAASLLPPLEVLARRYLFVEAVQFCVFALAAPALAVLGAPARLFTRGVVLSGAGRGEQGLAGLAEARRRPPVAAAAGYLVAWVVVCVAWRLPPVLDGLARHPVLVAPEAVALYAAGTGLWWQLVHSPPRAPRLPRPQRACVAALAMWSIWVGAYVLGFASHSVVPAYDRVGSHLLPVDDQEITAFVLWLAAALSFLPIVFTAVLTWLKDSNVPAVEPRRDGSVRAVRGWERPARGRRRTSAR
jgi:cytochrome c oxidase assembly factor CtaG